MSFTMTKAVLQRAVRFIVAAPLLAAVVAAIGVYQPYLRERKIARAIEQSGGSVDQCAQPPTWMPSAIHSRLPIFDRPWNVIFLPGHVPTSLLQNVRHLTANQALDLSNTTITDTDLEHLRGITSLWRLRLNGTSITDSGLECLQGMTDLRRLELRNTAITGSGLRHLRTMRNLRGLALSGTSVTNADLKQLKDFYTLKVLDLRSTPITDDGLKSLHEMTQLQEIWLEEAQTTEQGRDLLRKALPTCAVFP